MFLRRRVEYERVQRTVSTIKRTDLKLLEYERVQRTISTIKRTDLKLLEMGTSPLLKQKTLTKDMSLPFARSLEGLNLRVHA
jgi:hypothetical protein